MDEWLSALGQQLLRVVAVIVVAMLLSSWVTWSLTAAPPADEATEHERAHTQPRSGQWPAVRAAHLAKHPTCEACGSKATKARPLQVHHIIPFGVAGDGDADGDGITNELDPDNLITLCVDGVGHCDCHLLIGHGGNFRCHNANVVRDAKRFREMLTGKVCDLK